MEMSEASAGQTRSEVQALCCNCGTLRTASARYLSQRARPLRCAVCAGATEHVPVFWDDRKDSKEQLNNDESARAAYILGELAKIKRTLTHFGVELEYCLDNHGWSWAGEKIRAAASVESQRGPGWQVWQIVLDADLTPSQELHFLRTAWANLLTTDAEDDGWVADEHHEWTLSLFLPFAA